MKRVTAYCRVSTELDDQLNSLDNQKRYFEEYINKNPEWQFCGIYIDEGISGTSTAKRTGFKQMIQDAESQKFDLLLTKEISRFARNTLDSIYYTRKLKALGIGVLFMNDNINTLDADAELRLTIMSSIAQEESRKTSERVKWGQKRQMEKGVVFGNGVYGYDLTDGTLTVSEQQAEIVRLIFSLYLDEGMGVRLICQQLANRGIPSPSGDSAWKDATILRILKNEKYMGTLKQKKEITTDYLSHRKVVNDGREDYVIIESNHAPVIDADTFAKVQKEIDRRRTTALDKSKHSNRYVWSGRVECAYCQSKFKRKVWNRKSPTPSIVWECSERNKNGKAKVNEQNQKVGCDCRAVHEAALECAFIGVLRAVVGDRQSVIAELKQTVKIALQERPGNTEQTKRLQSEVERIYSKKSRLIEVYTDGAITRQEFDTVNDRYNRQLDTLYEQIAKLESDNERIDSLQKRLNEIDSAIEHIAGLEVFSESVCKQVLKKVVVKDRETISFYLQNGDINSDFFIPLCTTPYPRPKARLQ